MDLYRQHILDHYKHPHNFGHLASPDSSQTLFNSACGDKITMELTFIAKGKKQVVKDVRFSGEGCAVSQASASLLTDAIKGKPIGDVLNMQSKDITDLLGTDLTASRIKCAVLPLEAIDKAIVEWKTGHGV